jgi:hypothetical protein
VSGLIELRAHARDGDERRLLGISLRTLDLEAGALEVLLRDAFQIFGVLLGEGLQFGLMRVGGGAGVRGSLFDYSRDRGLTLGGSDSAQLVGNRAHVGFEVPYERGAGVVESGADLIFGRHLSQFAL